MKTIYGFFIFIASTAFAADKTDTKTSKTEDRKIASQPGDLICMTSTGGIEKDDGTAGFRGLNNCDSSKPVNLSAAANQIGPKYILCCVSK